MDEVLTSDCYWVCVLISVGGKEIEDVCLQTWVNMPINMWLYLYAIACIEQRDEKAVSCEYDD